MGYSMSNEQWEKLERLEQEGRRCSMATGRGGCFGRATVRETCERTGADAGRAGYHDNPDGTYDMVLCRRHALGTGYQGVNFQVVKSVRF
jgi:hypothetical protein